jgi:hypothetical protein
MRGVECVVCALLSGKNHSAGLYRDVAPTEPGGVQGAGCRRRELSGKNDSAGLYRDVAPTELGGMRGVIEEEWGYCA